MNTLTALLAITPTTIAGIAHTDGMNQEDPYAIMEVLVAPHGSDERQFGKNVELIGDWIAIATDTGKDGSLQPGSVLLYDLADPGRRPEEVLRAPDRNWPDEFGSDMAASGRRLLIGAPGDSEADWDSGAAWLYELEDDWSLVSSLQPKVVESGARFGDAVAIDGDWVAIGSPRSDGSGIASGAVHLFDGRSGSWRESQCIQAPDGASGDFFGDSLALCGKWLAVGSWGDDDRGEKSGSVWIFHLEREGWRAVQKLAPLELQSRDLFGCSLGLSDEWLLVGSSGWNTNQGAIHAFKLEDSTWRRKRLLRAPGGTSEEWLGYSLAMNRSLMVAGAPARRSGTTMNGGIDLFKLEADTWHWVQRVEPSGKDWRQPNQFGWSVATDGRRVMVGRIDDADDEAEAGRAWRIEPRKDVHSISVVLPGLIGRGR